MARAVSLFVLQRARNTLGTRTVRLDEEAEKTLTRLRQLFPSGRLHRLSFIQVGSGPAREPKPMATTLPASAHPLDAAHGDQRVRLHDVGWREYESLLTIRGEQSGVRLTYLEGELELTTPSIEHEALKTRLVPAAGGLRRRTGHRARGVRLLDGEVGGSPARRRGR